MGITNPKDLTQASVGAAKYLKQLYNSTGNWNDALRAYNAGLGNVNNGRAYKIPETINYVKKVNTIANKFEQGGIYDLPAATILQLKNKGYNFKYID
jgi:Transglycosylase SLT domain